MKTPMKFEYDGKRFYYPASPNAVEYMKQRNRFTCNEYDLRMLRLNGVKTITPVGIEIGKIEIAA